MQRFRPAVAVAALLPGERYRLRIIEEGDTPRLSLKGTASILLTVCLGTTPEKKHEIIHAFYCAELKKLVPELLDKWQQILDVMVSAWREQNGVRATSKRGAFG